MRRLALVVQLLLFPLAANGAPWTADNSAWNLNTNRDAASPEQYSGSWPGHDYFPSPADWRDVAVYHVMLDRFSDGDPNNNTGRYGGYNPGHPGMRQGGDFAGITSKLDYIAGMGFRAIWISGVFQNFENDYHGYGPIDFTLIDERLGTLKELRALVEAAHDRGIYIILDVVVNHLNDFYYPKGYKGRAAPFRFHDGEYELEPRSEQRYADFSVNNTFYPEGRYCDVFDHLGRRKIDHGSGSFWESDFHHNGQVSDSTDGWNQQLGEIYGFLDDLRTSHPRVQNKIIAMTKALIASTDIDAIRMDTPMLVPLCFFKKWAPAVRGFATTLGKDNFAVFGEFYNTHFQAATMIGRGKEFGHYGPSQFIDDVYVMDGGINYRLYHTFVLPALYHGLDGYIDHAKEQLDWQLRVYDLEHPTARDRRYRMLNFYNNHDQRRICVTPHGAEKNRLGMFLVSMWPGLPLIYFGDEQGLCSYGTALEGHGRESFMSSLAWSGHPSPLGTNPATDDNFNMVHPDYLFLKRLLEVRELYPALRRSNSVTEQWRSEDNKNGLYAFSRETESPGEEVLVVMNTAAQTFEVPQGGIPTPWPAGTTVVDVFDPARRATLLEDGRWTGPAIPPYQGRVLVREEQYRPLKPQVVNVMPAHDQPLSQPPAVWTIIFSDQMKPESVIARLTVDGERVAYSDVQLADEGRSFSVVLGKVPDGMHHLRLEPGAVSVGGRKLSQAFTARFRVGRPENVLLSRGVVSDDSLINDGAQMTADSKVKLHHKAEGASFYRASNDGGRNWSTWMRYEPVTEWDLGIGNGYREVLVQYWADGSAAYFTKDWIDRHLHDGFGFE